MKLLANRPGMAATRLIEYNRDRIAIEAHIRQHGPCSLCLPYSRDTIRGHLAGLLGQAAIEECYFGGKKWRAVV